MPNNQSTNFVYVLVTNNESLSFLYDLSTQSIVNESSASTQNAISTIEVSKETYEKLVNGQSTFEKEVHYGSIQIGGDYKQLLSFGESLANDSN